MGVQPFVVVACQQLLRDCFGLQEDFPPFRNLRLENLLVIATGGKGIVIAQPPRLLILPQTNKIHIPRQIHHHVVPDALLPVERPQQVGDEHAMLPVYWAQEELVFVGSLEQGLFQADPGAQ